MVVSQQRVGAIAIDYPGRAGDMADLEGAVKAIRVRLDEFAEARRHCGFVSVEWTVGTEFFEEWIAVHDFHLNPGMNGDKRRW